MSLLLEDGVFPAWLGKVDAAVAVLDLGQVGAVMLHGGRHTPTAERAKLVRVPPRFVVHDGLLPEGRSAYSYGVGT